MDPSEWGEFDTGVVDLASCQTRCPRWVYAHARILDCKGDTGTWGEAGAASSIAVARSVHSVLLYTASLLTLSPRSMRRAWARLL